MEQGLEIDGERLAVRAPFPDGFSGPAQRRETLDLRTPQTAVEHVRNRRQEIAHGVLHAADVRLRNGIAVGGQTPGEFALGERLAAFLFIEFPGLLDAQGAFDERESAVQFVLGEVPGQRDDLAAPGTEQAGDAEETLVLRLRPQFTQDGKPGVAAVADDVVIRAGPAGDGRRRIQPAFADRGLDLVVEGIAGDARIEFIGAQFIERDHDRGIAQGIAQGVRVRAGVRETFRQKLDGHRLGGKISHACLLARRGTPKDQAPPRR